MKKFGAGMIALSIIVFITGLIMKMKQRAAIGIISGADGPTSVFIAGTVGNGFGMSTIFAGVILVIAAVLILYKSKKK